MSIKFMSNREAYNRLKASRDVYYSEREFYIFCTGREFVIDEHKREELYKELLRGGMSDSEARGTAYEDYKY